MAEHRTVAAVVTHGVHPFELAVPWEVFGVDRSDLGLRYRFFVCAVEEPPIVTSAGFTIDTPHGPSALRRADTLVVPAGANDRDPPAPLLDALRAAERRGARILSVCTGAFVLAEAGLLDGRRATTHWMHAAELAQRYPSVEVDPDVLYVDDGPIMTSAGSAAGLDLCLHVVRLDYGAEVANALARRMVVAPHRDGGQAQFIEAPVGTTGCDPFEGVLEWAQAHVDEPLTVDDLARRSAMSPRTFARRFRAATGTTPYRWLLRQRVFLAQRLLETTDEPVELVAQRSGFGSAAALRQHFQPLVGCSPSGYRHSFHCLEGE